MNIDILYEDKDILAINKPAGLIVHSDGRPVQEGQTKEKSLTDWIVENYPEIEGVGEPARTPEGKLVDRPGIVHRLDRETSGVMLIAKTKEGFDFLKKQFQNHDIQKEYLAFVYGEIPEKINGVNYANGGKRGIIDRPIGRSSSDFRQWSAQRGARGEMREAITEFEVLQKGKGYSLIKVFPKTGRTHQIRVHFKAINYPLVSDSLYAPNRENSLGFKRVALHSEKVTFKSLDGEIHEISAPYPEDFNLALGILQN